MQYRRHVLVCTNEKPLHCAENGGLELYEKFKSEINAAGLQNEVLVSKTGCTHQHHCGPTVIIHPDGIWYKLVTPADVPEIVQSHLMQNKIVVRLHNLEIGVKTKS